MSKLKTSANQQITHICKGQEREVKGKIKAVARTREPMRVSLPERAREV